MNILDKMPKRLIQLMLNQGLTFELGRDNDHRIYLDLNTGMKSHLHLYYEAGSYVVHMRYNEERVVCDLSDIRWAIRSCMHGRDFMNSAWDIPYKEGFGEFSDEPLDYLK